MVDSFSVNGVIDAVLVVRFVIFVAKAQKVNQCMFDCGKLDYGITLE